MLVLIYLHFYIIPVFNHLANLFRHIQGGSTNLYSHQQNTVPCTALPGIVELTHIYVYKINACTHANIFKIYLKGTKMLSHCFNSHFPG